MKKEVAEFLNSTRAPSGRDELTRKYRSFNFKTLATTASEEFKDVESELLELIVDDPELDAILNS
jgi:hypothetical protein